MEGFREVLAKRNLNDLGWKCEKFTWSNRHGDESSTKERLDRAVANSAWIEVFNEVWVEILAARTSDHKPILIHVLKGKKRNWVKNQGFKYEANWALEEDCEEVMRHVWNKDEGYVVPLEKVVTFLDRSKKALLLWSRQRRRGGEREIEEKTRVLQ
ncbi:uncharacterized protein LOC118348178 [Juglans regia]|uniref:Uncharacterized protein LOC118348178 n=1 Tax=Juglans regia TaxID=51240 RepID=A0A6P9EMF2_JUGRE|nr:uncharacterized protein LOC118348178 [Juglans regia]